MAYITKILNVMLTQTQGEFVPLHTIKELFEVMKNSLETENQLNIEYFSSLSVLIVNIAIKTESSVMDIFKKLSIQNSREATISEMFLSRALLSGLSKEYMMEEFFQNQTAVEGTELFYDKIIFSYSNLICEILAKNYGIIRAQIRVTKTSLGWT
jgi:hypothetical protein